MRRCKTLVLSAGGFLVTVLFSAAAPVAQQHGYTDAQIAEGRMLYQNNCGRCHNNDGNGVVGVELFKQFRRATTDDDIAKLIQNGIPGTSMPQHRFSTPQALSVVAFLRSMVGVTPGSAAITTGRRSSGLAGDATRGKTIFTGKGGCATCHKAEHAGGTTGPDLSEAGVIRDFGFGPIPPDPALLEQSILEPNADITPAYRVFQVTPKTGAPIRGTLLNQDTFSVQMHDEAKNLRSFLRSDLKDAGFLPSPMPSSQGRLTPQEVADVVSYLLTLKGSK
ncbi:MAG TPA: c-type cytochrome [Vicinamibacterales bacterium]|jgi:putative heme-binding domain-containing protein|nr:c-type cytochrome [Vicinamibacterales bacterium]